MANESSESETQVKVLKNRQGEESSSQASGLSGTFGYLNGSNIDGNLNNSTTMVKSSGSNMRKLMSP